MKTAKGRILGLLVAGMAACASAQEQAVPTTVSTDVHNAAATAPLTPGAAELIRLAQSGVQEDVLLAYAQGVTDPFNLSADNIVYLRDLGISSPVLTAMLNRDKEIKDKVGAQPAVQEVAQPVLPESFFPPNEMGMVPPPQTAYPMPDASYVGNPPSEVSYFYNDLAPYGSWVVLPSYGWCWQPSVVVLNQGWRPYCDAGQWVYSGVGWYWQSDYSWGWAPFHYGRWMQHPNCGWVWFPDTTWSPAWVTWRVAGDNCGWAPMPWRSTFDARHGYGFNGVSVGASFDFGLHPDSFTFVGVNNLCSSNLRQHCLPPTQTKHAFSGSTVLNNFTVQDNQTIVNGGISAERVERATGTQLRPATVQVSRGETKNVRGGRPPSVAGPGAPTAPLVRRELTAPVRATPMFAERVDDRQLIVRHPELAAINVADRRVAPVATTPPSRGPVAGNPPTVTGAASSPVGQYQPPGTYYRGNARAPVTTVTTGTRGRGVQGATDARVLESPKDRSQPLPAGRYETRGSLAPTISAPQTQTGPGPAPQSSRGLPSPTVARPATVPSSSAGTPTDVGGSRSADGGRGGR